MTASPEIAAVVAESNGVTSDTSDECHRDVETVPTKPTPLVFAFAKKTSAPLVASVAAIADDIEIVEHDEISIIDDGGIVAKDGTRKRKGPLVIPMMKVNDWRMSASAKKTNEAILASVDVDDAAIGTDKPTLTNLHIVDPTDLVAVAKAQLLKAAADIDNADDDDVVDDIPLLMQNKVPDGFETDDKLDVSLRPGMSSVADYESVPINQFGAAMLRGMGWSEGAPIGKSNKVVHLPKIPELRPKGMGLGANKSLVEKLKNKNRKGGKSNVDATETKLVMEVGAYARLTSGEYCRIESVDADMNRCVVRLAIGGGSRSVSQLKMELVSKEEFDKEGRCINKTKYDEAKAAREREVIEIDSGSADDRDARSKKKKSSKSKRHSPPPPSRRRPWLHVDIVVRIVDERSRHFKEKMVVLDVTDGGHSAQLRTMHNQVLEKDLPAHHLETVVPRQEDALVKVLNAGGLLARVISQDRQGQKALIEMVDNDETREVHFDHISQYVEHD